jgi:ADP-heptose:LPS heptosyltransferase
MRKKLLIRLGEGVETALASFPFLHAIHQEWEDAEINVILSEDQRPLLDFLPFMVRTYVLDEGKNNFLGIHKFAYNLKDVFNIDIYFDLAEGLKSSFLGKSFKATDRVGWQTRWNKFFLTHGFEQKENLKQDRLYLELLENYLDKSFKELKIIGKEPEESPENFFGAHSPEPYLLLGLDLCEEKVEETSFWKEVFGELSEKKVILWSEEDVQCSQKEELVKDKELHVLAQHMDLKSLSTYFNYTQGVITTKPWLARLANYYGVDTLLLTNSFREVPFLEHYQGQLNLVQFEKGQTSYALLGEDERALDGIGPFVDLIHEKFHI